MQVTVLSGYFTSPRASFKRKLNQVLTKKCFTIVNFRWSRWKRWGVLLKLFYNFSLIPYVVLLPNHHCLAKSISIYCIRRNTIKRIWFAAAVARQWHNVWNTPYSFNLIGIWWVIGPISYLLGSCLSWFNPSRDHFLPLSQIHYTELSYITQTHSNLHSQIHTR